MQDSEELGISLPEQFTPPTPANLYRYLSNLIEFLTSPLAASIFSSHPNDAAVDDFGVPNRWEDWWEWASLDTNGQYWKSLVHLAYGKLQDPSQFDIHPIISQAGQDEAAPEI